MSALFEELAYVLTPLGELILRRRRDPSSEQAIYEIKLNDEFLMSNLFTEGERQLSHLGLAPFAAGSQLDVVVGGLGLGYSAVAALEHENVSSLLVIEALPEVIQWHEQKLLPLGERLCGDPRCRLIHGDFFAMNAGNGFDPEQPERQWDAILVDIDHSPRAALHASHRDFYTQSGLSALRGHLKPNGRFALWSNDPPDEGFLAELERVFSVSSVKAHIVEFHNPYQDRTESDTIYVVSPALKDLHA